MSKADFTILLNAATIVLIPFVYSWVKSQVLPDWVRFILACLTCILVGALSAVVTGSVTTSASIIQNASTVIVLSYGVYYAVFRGLHLEAILFPRASVINLAEKSVAAQIGTMSSQTIKDATDPLSSTAIKVSAESVTYLGPETSAVLPQG